MSEKRTTVVVEAQTKGLDKAARETRGVRDSMRELGEASKAFEGLEKTLTKVLKEFKSVVDTARSFSKEIRDANNEMDKAKRKPSGFAMGVAQGSGMGEYFPSDMRLAPQIAGRQVGGMLRGGAAAAGSVFTGLAGFQTGLSSLPGGGFLAGQVGQAAASAEAALAYQQAQASTMMFGSSTPRFQMKGGLEAAERVALEMQSSFDKQYSVDNFRKNGSVPGSYLESYIGKPGRQGDVFDDLPRATQRDFVQRDKERAEAAHMEATGVAMGDAFRKNNKAVKIDPFAAMEGAGVQFGMDRMQAREFLGGMLQASGGTAEGLDPRKASQAMAASKRFGLGGDVAGIFARGERMGAGGGMLEAIRSGMSLALEGSDLTNFTRQTAQAMMAFEQTGMPLDISGVRDMTAALSGSGLGRERSVAVGQGLLSAGRRISQNGVSNAADFTMLRDFYGFQGGGTEDYFAAIKRAESGKMDSKGLDKRLDVVKGNFDTTTAKGSASAALSIRSYLQTLGVQIGAGEAEKLVTGDAGARAKIEAELKGAGQRAAGFTGDDLLKQGTVGGGLQRQAGLSNQRIGSGQNMLKMVQDFEEAQGAATKSVSALVGQFDELSGTIAKISESLPQDASTWQAFGDAVRQITLGH
jgi:hypothetical protein